MEGALLESLSRLSDAAICNDALGGSVPRHSTCLYEERLESLLEQYGWITHLYARLLDPQIDIAGYLL